MNSDSNKSPLLNIAASIVASFNCCNKTNKIHDEKNNKKIATVEEQNDSTSVDVKDDNETDVPIDQT